MAKQLLYETEARKKILEGVNKLSRAVITTLGPKGRNVAIQNNHIIKIVHDGVTVARSIILKDEFENLGAQVVKGAASRTNDIAGDGTTTSILLAKMMIEYGFHLIDSGTNAMFLKRGLDKALGIVKKELDKLSKPIKTVEELIQIAIVSAQDEEIGKKVANAVEKVGENGVISVREGSKNTIEIEHVEGMELENGAISYYFVTNPDRMEVEIENPVVLFTDLKIGSGDELIPFLQNISPKNKNIVIIADEVDGDALHLLVVNKQKGALNTCAVKVPGFGERKRGILEDLAILTGGRVVSSDEGVKLDNIPFEYLGQADIFWANKEKSRIIGGKGDKTEVAKRIKYLRLKAEETEGEFDREKFLERAASLENGIALIRVGATTEIERKDKLEKVKDAVGATRAAKEEGIIVGGGVAFLRASNTLKTAVNLENNEDIKAGMKVVLNTLKWPTKQILLNAGEDERTLVKVEEGNDNFGYDILTGEYGDLIEKGVIDPVKVAKSALENAVSVAGMLLTTECLIVDEKEEIPNHQH